MKAAVPCPVCAGSETAPALPGAVACLSCGHIRADLDLEREDFCRLYGESYFFGEEYPDYPADKAVIQKNFRLRLRELERFLEPGKTQDLLEIGCAYGFFLETAKERFRSVTGIDICESAVRHARETLALDAVAGDFLERDFGRSFGVVCLWDVIEHLPRPDLFLEKISRITLPGGLIALTTGDIGSPLARRRKERWRLYHPPTHIHYFTRDNLRRFLERYGYSVLHDRTAGFYRSLDLAAYRLLGLRGRRRGLYHAL